MHDDDMQDEYAIFLTHKRLRDEPSGINVPLSMLPDVLFDWQRVLVRWALQRGRAALFASTGLGKTLCQLVFAQHVPGNTLIMAPLAVTHQTIREAARHLKMEVAYVRSQSEMQDGIVSITNYDRLDAFIGADIEAIILDESSILKALTSKTRAALVANFTHIPFRLCCTATPAPNDIAEIANHAAFLGVMTRASMLSTFFVHDDDGWRLRGHAHEAFYRWMASWAMALRTPADLGYEDAAFQLPPLTIVPHFLATPWRREGEMFPGVGLKGIQDRAQVRSQTARARAHYAREIVMESLHGLPAGPGAGQEQPSSASRSDPASRTPQWIIWCGLNTEQDILGDLFGEECVSIQGKTLPDTKIVLHDMWLAGKRSVLISKPSVFGHGMNWQHCAHALFCGLSDSWESWFQAVRRIWRYGQTQPVTIHVVLSEHEKPIWDNIQRKEQEALGMMHDLIETIRDYQKDALTEARDPIPSPSLARHDGAGWRIYEGDCIESMHHIPDNSVDLSVFSPPFLALYQYSPTDRDLGNCTDEAQFFAHFAYVSQQLLRVTRPGRLVAMHTSDVPAMQVRDGWIGLKNFSGHMIDHMSSQGWLFHGKYVIDKNPQAQAIRIHAKGLAFGQLHKDASWMRAALPDYLLLFRKPGENLVPIHPDIDNNTWIQWAYPVWYSTARDPQGGIRETITLNAAEARESDDDRHICPLALDLIERCVRLWSNEGETILDPFCGIGSTGYVAIQHGRRFIGCELKSSYARTAIRNLHQAVSAKNQMTLFALDPTQ